MISIHPPRVGRDANLQALYYPRFHISIHPPRVGRDGHGGLCCRCGSDFNPPSPCGEGPVEVCILDANQEISIHPPRVGRDRSSQKFLPASQYFNPPSPCGEGPASFCVPFPQILFQSTLPVWGGTDTNRMKTDEILISIHPPRVGRDPDRPGHPRTPAISIHPPRVGRDSKSSQKFFVNFCARR